MINIAHTDRNVFLRDIIDIGTLEHLMSPNSNADLLRIEQQAGFSERQRQKLRRAAAWLCDSRTAGSTRRRNYLQMSPQLRLRIKHAIRDWINPERGCICRSLG
jgi:hypothetical protein